MNRATSIKFWIGDKCVTINPETKPTPPKQWKTGNACIDFILNDELFGPLFKSPDLSLTRTQWREQLLAASQTPTTSDDISKAFHSQWHVCHHFVRELVDDDYLLMDMLWAWLPRYQGPDLILYRGENIDRFEAGRIGTAWSNQEKIAERFAVGLNAIRKGGVVLRTTAPADSIIAGPSSHSYYLGESEFSVDTRKLKTISQLKTFPPAPGM